MFFVCIVLTLVSHKYFVNATEVIFLFRLLYYNFWAENYNVRTYDHHLKALSHGQPFLTPVTRCWRENTAAIGPLHPGASRNEATRHVQEALY